MGVLKLIGIIICLIVLIPSIMSAFSVRRRHRLWTKKLAYADGMVWYRVVGESKREGKNRKGVKDQLVAVRSFAKSVTESDGGAFCSVIWDKTDDGSINLYIGATKSVSDSSGVFNRLARGINGRLERASGPPEIDASDLAVAYRRDYEYSQINKELSSVGKIAEDFSQAEMSGRIIMTFEGAARSETERLNGNISETAIMKGGAAVAHSGVGDKSAYMASTAVRATIAASSGKGSYSSSSNLLSFIIGSIPSLAILTRNKDIKQVSQLSAIKGLIPGILIVVLMTFIAHAVPLVAGSIITGFLVITMGLLILKPDVLIGNYINDEVSNGYLSIPRYVWANPRWFLHGMYRKYYRRDAGGNHMGNRVAPPSSKQVLHMYDVSLAEFMTFPNNVIVDDLAEDRLPKKGFGEKFVPRGDNDMFYGFSGTGQPTSVALNNCYKSLYVSGGPDSGKSHFLEFLFMNYSYLAAHNTKGYQITPIWGEIKGEGAYELYDLVKDINPKTVMIDAHNPRGEFRLSLEGPRIDDRKKKNNELYKIDTIVSNVGKLIDGLQFAYGDGIQAESKQALSYSMTASMLLYPSELEFLELSDELRNPQRPNIIHLAYLLLGGDSEMQKLKGKLSEFRKDLKQKVKDGDVDDRERNRIFHLHRALGILISYNDPKNDAKKQPALNKLSDMINAEVFWEPRESARDIPIRLIPKHFAPIILNMGPYMLKNGNFSSNIQPKISRLILLTITQMMWTHIKSACTGWQAQKKMIPLFFDEVRNVAVDSSDAPNVISEIYADGRSKGTFLVSASQKVLNQLPAQAQRIVMSFDNKLTFSLPEADDRSEILKQLGDNAVFNDSHIKNVYQPFAIVVSLYHSQNGNFSPFTLEVPYVKTWKKYISRNNTLTSSIIDYEHVEEKASDTQVDSSFA